jgi:hypothetical protein
MQSEAKERSSRHYAQMRIVAKQNEKRKLGRNWVPTVACSRGPGKPPIRVEGGSLSVRGGAAALVFGFPCFLIWYCC